MATSGGEHQSKDRQQSGGMELRGMGGGWRGLKGRLGLKGEGGGVSL